ncbi:MAG: hypothetical protein GVY12_10050, partial [Bacteroidetes bacterium]|nr:hypothetical protein [Bacteroidota bacterium]
MGGLLGSAHCVGMCGGFALAAGTTSDRSASLCFVTSAEHSRCGSPIRYQDSIEPGVAGRR